MNFVVPKALFTLALLALPPGMPATAHAAPDCDPRDLLRKVVTEQGRRPDHPQGFTRDRSLLEYLRNFPPELGSRINRLDGSGLILEAGAGEAIAAEQLLQTRLEGLLLDEADEARHFKYQMTHSHDPAPELLRLSAKPLKDRPTVIALTKDLDRSLPLAPYQGKLKLITGQFFEEVPHAALGRPDLILDSIGVMSYTAEPSKVLRKYLEILKPDGDVYLLLDRSTRMEGARVWTAANRDRTRIEAGIGNSLDLFEWLKSLDGRGLEVKELETGKRIHFMKDGVPTYQDHRLHTIRIRRTGGRIEIPELKLTQVLAEDNPPRRFFQVIHSQH